MLTIPISLLLLYRQRKYARQARKLERDLEKDSSSDNDSDGSSSSKTSSAKRRSRKSSKKAAKKEEEEEKPEIKTEDPETSTPANPVTAQTSGAGTPAVLVDTPLPETGSSTGSKEGASVFPDFYHLPVASSSRGRGRGRGGRRRRVLRR
jgi:cytoskeletal protein RodZ